MRSTLPTASAPLLSTVLLLMLTACTESKFGLNDPYTQVEAFRIPSELCQSKSPECREWRDIAYRCEMGLQEKQKGNFDNPFSGSCQEMEDYRERVTGIKDSSVDGAYAF